MSNRGYRYLSKTYVIILIIYFFKFSIIALIEWTLRVPRPKVKCTVKLKQCNKIFVTFYKPDPICYTKPSQKQISWNHFNLHLLTVSTVKSGSDRIERKFVLATNTGNWGLIDVYFSKFENRNKRRGEASALQYLNLERACRDAFACVRSHPLERYLRFWLLKKYRICRSNFEMLFIDPRAKVASVFKVECFCFVTLFYF